MRYVVGPKGHIVIAKAIRDRLGIEPGWTALQRLEGDHLAVYFVPPEHERSLKGSLAPYLNAGVPAAGWAAAREAAWEKAARERAGLST